MCPYCKKPLKWKHMVPIFSYLVLGGKCAYCRKRISSHYVLLEILTAALFVIVFLNFNFITTVGSSVDPSVFSYSIDFNVFELFIFYLIEAGLMMGIFFYDLLYKEIPDVLSLPAIAVGFLGALLFGTPELQSLGIAVLIIVVFFGGQILLSKGHWLGGGDLRLGVLLAVLLGAKLLILALVLSYVLGSIVSLVLLACKKATRKTAIPFGPFLITGGLISLFIVEKIVTMYLNNLIP